MNRPLRPGFGSPVPVPAFLFFAFLFFAVLPCGAAISFSGLDISEDRLLVRAASSGGGAETQSALLLADLSALSGGSVPVRQLSVFPEKMELVEGGKTLLVHNTFGSQRLSLEGGLPEAFPGFPSFASGPDSGYVPGGRVENTAASPDGRWLLYVEPVSHGRGTLVLLDGLTGRRVNISREIERPGRFFPARWSADSRLFLYARGGRIYFYTVNTRAAPPEERWRAVGGGTVNSAAWGTGPSAPWFYYLRDSTVFRVRTDELFARTLYGGFLETGEMAGKLPFEFDPGFDRFWVSPDGLSIILCKAGRDLFFYPLETGGDARNDTSVLPYVAAPRSGARINVLWSGGGIATALIGVPGSSGSGSGPVLAYRLHTRPPGRRSFESLESPPALGAALSPDGERVLFWGPRGLFLYDYRNWKPLEQLSAAPVYSALWLGNGEVISGGGERIERIRLSGNAPAERRLLCLAQAEAYGFVEEAPPAAGGTAPLPAAPAGTAPPSPGGSGQAPAETAPAAVRRVAARTGGVWYVTGGDSPWVEYRLPPVREASLISPRFRVYLETAGGFFENIPMIRNTSSVGTFPLFRPWRVPPPPALYSERNPSRLPDAGEDFVFTRGSRDVKEAALVFDLYDDDAGLSAALDALDRFGVRATFFINGEFIRRNPRAVRELAEAGHECASMFYAPQDLSDLRYRVGGDYIARGLARNEDEFFKASGKELALIWHPPYYALSREIAAAAAAAGYRTTGRDVDSRDWIRSADAARLGMDRPSAADMIDAVMDAKGGGSIIPIRLGLLEGGGDYLFNSLEVLMDALVREGYELVPVSTLLNRTGR
ncbi:MAG: polysaccharide deacetylase family protein [Treponema sp.]|jgi:peptidoglycan/xylan/chitin deacetylase (PgdA/CDA1 family)|nr:polysaccharide deacetylase family protein [Treponema sp.]